MKRSLIAILLLGACTSDSGEPLVGTWGGGGSQVVARMSSFEVTLGCDTYVRVGHRIELDRLGTFTIADSIVGVRNDTLPGQAFLAIRLPVLLIGTVTGDRLSIAMAYLDPATRNPVANRQATIVFDGRRGQPRGSVACRI